MKPIKGGQHPEKNKEVDKMLKEMAEMINGSRSKRIPNDTGVKYSRLLLDLIKPYERSKGMMPIEELEYLLDMGITAWNLSVYKKKDEFFYKSYLAAVKSIPAFDNAMEKLLNKLVADKEKLFGQYSDTLLEDFEIIEKKKGEVMVNVYSKPFDGFIRESLAAGIKGNPFEPAREEDDDDDRPDYVLPAVNRNAVMIKPKQPFLDWLRKIHFPKEPPALRQEPAIYLLPEYESGKEAEIFLKQNFDRIFCSELWGWDLDEKNWPANRTYKMFKEWFDVKMQCLVYDIANQPLESD
jgi:hypothetical protein